MITAITILVLSAYVLGSVIGYYIGQEVTARRADRRPLTPAALLPRFSAFSAGGRRHYTRPRTPPQPSGAGKMHKKRIFINN